jgi:(p)ppGpp synthase/HD superfamily hydrolase
MIKFTDRLNKAINVAATAHRNQTRKGSDTPYIVHPFGTMLIASNATDDEDTLIACLFHDIVEDVSEMYSKEQIKSNFGENVLNIVLDVTKNDDIEDWRERSKAYLAHLENQACDQAVIVSASDKINNIHSVLIDYAEKGEELWDVFTTKSSADQVWWYESILEVIKKRNAPEILVNELSDCIDQLKNELSN